MSWDPTTSAITPDTQLPGWVHTTKLVAKPDQLIKRRGKAGLLALNKSWPEAKEWIAERAGKHQKVRFYSLHDDLCACHGPRYSLAIFTPVPVGIFITSPGVKSMRLSRPSCLWFLHRFACGLVLAR